MLCFQAFCQISFSDQTAAGCLLPASSLSNSVDFQEIKRESENRRRANRRTTRPLFRTPFKYLLTLTESLLRIWRLNIRHVNCSSSVFLSAGWGWSCLCPRGVRYVKVNSDNIVTFHSSSALCLVFFQQAGELKNLSWGEKNREWRCKLILFRFKQFNWDFNLSCWSNPSIFRLFPSHKETLFSFLKVCFCTTSVYFPLIVLISFKHGSIAHFLFLKIIGSENEETLKWILLFNIYGGIL